MLYIAENKMKIIPGMCLQETFVRRSDEKKAMDKRNERMVSTLLKDFPCFELGPYIVEETRLILGKSAKEIERLFHNAKQATTALLRMIPRDRLKRQASSKLFSHRALFESR